MPVEVKSKEEFLKILERASECRVKLGYRRKRTEEGTRRIKVLKVKARTPSYLYTLVFENIDEGIEFIKSIKEKCPNMVVFDEEIRSKLG
jgi:large subunit ribosomal protein L38e